MYMWRAVDGEGEFLDVLVQRRRDMAAVHNTFNVQRYLICRPTHRQFRAGARNEWSDATVAAT